MWEVKMRNIVETLRTWFQVAMIIAVGNCVAEAQIERYELGKRLRRFEEAWHSAPEEIRANSAAFMQEAVQSFFSLNLQEAARKLDKAWVVTRGNATEEWERGAIPYRIDLSSSLFDSNAESCTVSLKKLYESDEPLPAGITVEWHVVDEAGSRTLERRELSWEESLQGVPLSLAQLPMGDFQLHVSIRYEGKRFDLPPVMISRVENLMARLGVLNELSRDRTTPWNDSVRATIREHVLLMNQKVQGTPLETDYPFHRILALDEALVSDESDVRSLISQSASEHDVWLSLADGRRRVPVRIRSPRAPLEAAVPSAPLPVLFLHHGAGGSENMFFETYGAGGVVQAGLERGWLVVAPRQGLTGLTLDCAEMLTALDSFFEVDREHVYLVGHSMGAAQVIRQVGLHPDLPAAAAVIGGGTPPGDARRLAAVAWYVSAGELDFGRRGANAFFRSLKSVNAKRIRYEEFPGVEHMVIVQASIPSLFEFLDQVRTDTLATKN